jgi:acetylornithine deacetylase/succinyl-diaminopimelate desuccinylase-like protein
VSGTTSAPILELVLGRVDELGDELVHLTQKLANAYCPPGQEHTAAAVATEWLDANGIPYDVHAASPERPSIVGKLAGSDPAGTSLLFNSHLDSPISREHDHLRLRNPLDPKYTSAWVEGDRVYGYGAVNDKGPMAAWMIACKALKDTGAPLRGDVFLTMVAGEIGQWPMEEFQGPAYDGTGMGARELVAAGVRADHVLVAEATGFTAAWVEAGKANFRVTVYAGPSRYTPHIPRPVPFEQNPNAIIRSGPLLVALEDWAVRYQEEHTKTYEGGTIVPKVNLGAIRSGVLYNLERVPEVCRLYIDVRTLPEADPEAIRASLEALVASQGLEATVELVSYHAGAESPGVDPLIGALRRVHAHEFGAEMEPATPVMSSQWRDTIPFADAGMPALTYGPSFPTGGRDEYFMERSDLLSAARVYARLAVELCS